MINISQLEVPKSSIYATQALEILAQVDPDFRDLSDVVMQDPILASTILRYANSPLNRRASEISNVPVAITLLGVKSLRSAIVTATLHSLVPADSSVCAAILDHTLNVAVASRLIAQVVCPLQEHDLEFLGLVHDLGMLVLATNFSTQYANILSISNLQNIAIDLIETNEFGVSHDEVGVFIARTYRLPKADIELLAGFHDEKILSSNNGGINRDINILYLAHLLLNELRSTGLRIIETLPLTLQQLECTLGLTKDSIDSIRSQLNDHINGSHQS